MKRMMWGMALSVLASGAADAALLSRAGGQAYYDTVLDIIWLADENYAQTSGYDSDGRMTRIEAPSWIGSLNAEGGGTGHLGTITWRLPNIVDTGTVACLSLAYSGTDCGWNVQTGSAATTVYSEMASLFYDTSGAGPQPGWGLTNIGPFSNLQPSYYWSSQVDTSMPWNAWDFSFGDGIQGVSTQTNSFYAWAVHDGDIGAVPAPGALWLFGAGMAALGAKLTRRARGAGTVA